MKITISYILFVFVVSSCGSPGGNNDLQDKQPIKDSCIGDACGEILYLWNNANTFKNVGVKTIRVSVQGKLNNEELHVRPGKLEYSLESKFRFPYIANYVENTVGQYKPIR